MREVEREGPSIYQVDRSGRDIDVVRINRKNITELPCGNVRSNIEGGLKIVLECGVRSEIEVKAYFPVLVSIVGGCILDHERAAEAERQCRSVLHGGGLN